MGYYRAGFDVTGVDLAAIKGYPFTFIQDDAIEYLRARGHEYDFIHASPPCQHYSKATASRGLRSDHPDLVGKTRAELRMTGAPWVIENVGQAPIRRDLWLCGSQFGLIVRRHRAFESSVPLVPPLIPHNHAISLPFIHKGERAYVDAMGCNWMTVLEGREAIPPAYTLFIGRQLI
jgi:hypothetical protein